MVQARRRLGLPLEARRERRLVGVLAVEHLDGDGLVEREVARTVDRAHRAGPDEALHQELAGDGAADELIEGLGHQTTSLANARPRAQAIARELAVNEV